MPGCGKLNEVLVGKELLLRKADDVGGRIGSVDDARPKNVSSCISDGAIIRSQHFTPLLLLGKVAVGVVVGVGSGGIAAVSVAVVAEADFLSFLDEVTIASQGDVFPFVNRLREEVPGVVVLLNAVGFSPFGNMIRELAVCSVGGIALVIKRLRHIPAVVRFRNLAKPCKLAVVRSVVVIRAAFVRIGRGGECSASVIGDDLFGSLDGEGKAGIEERRAVFVERRRLIGHGRGRARVGGYIGAQVIVTSQEVNEPVTIHISQARASIATLFKDLRQRKISWKFCPPSAISFVDINFIAAAVLAWTWRINMPTYYVDKSVAIDIYESIPRPYRFGETIRRILNPARALIDVHFADLVDAIR